MSIPPLDINYFSEEMWLSLSENHTHPEVDPGFPQGDDANPPGGANIRNCQNA